MCRNIKTLHNFAPPASDDEVRAAALQFVRKLSGTTKPSQANSAAFERAVDEPEDVEVDRSEWRAIKAPWPIPAVPVSRASMNTPGNPRT